MLTRPAKSNVVGLLLAFQTIIVVGQYQYDALMSGKREFFPPDVMHTGFGAVIPCVLVVLILVQRYVGLRFALVVCAFCSVLPTLVLWELLRILIEPN